MAAGTVRRLRPILSGSPLPFSTTGTERFESFLADGERVPGGSPVAPGEGRTVHVNHHLIMIRR